MINMQEVLETNNMIAHEKLDVRTITMGISLLDCVDSDLAKMNETIRLQLMRKILYRPAMPSDVNLGFRSSINVSRLLRSRW